MECIFLINVDGGLSGQFAGVRTTSAEGAAQKIVVPTLDDLLQFSTRFVPEAARREFELELRKLYQQ